MEVVLDTTSPPISHHGDMTVKDKDIVIIGLQPWYYEIGSNCKNIATLLSRHNRVLYVNIPLNRKTCLSKNKSTGVLKHYSIIKKGGVAIRLIQDNLWEFYPASIVESINWLPSTTAFTAINYINNQRLARDIKKAVQFMGFKNIILFNDNDIFNGYYLKELLQPSLYVYYCRDFLQGFDYWKKHCTTLEPRLIKKADAVVTNSTYYADYCARYNPHAYYIGQGCNIELFNYHSTHPLPDGLKQLKGPVIGYTGAIDSSRLDEKIIEQVALNRPGWNIVLVGPEDSFFAASSLHRLKNVHFLGRKPLEQLPAYVAAFDVCINPQKLNNITQGNYPLKADEYLAMGKPMVATRTQAMELFAPYTYLANEPGEYTYLIEKALSENSEAKIHERVAFARSHTWEQSVNELYKVIGRHLHPSYSIVA
jgi:glycosyltransferase involved in cell wall biosynthesis